MTERKRMNDETMARLRADPWLEAFVATRRRRPFRHQRAKDLAALVAGIGGTEDDAASEASGAVRADPDDEVVCGATAQVTCTSVAD